MGAINRIDEQVFALRRAPANDGVTILHMEDARKAVSAETDLLRLAIIRQVPVTFQEAAVVLFHLWTIFDVDEKNADEQASMEIAHDNLFDFMGGEGGNDGLGEQFAYSEKLARERRQRRSGLVVA